MQTKPKFSNVRKTDFYARLQEAVNEYFQSKKIRRTGNLKLYTKTVILFSILVGIYLLLILGNLPWWVSLPFCVLLGMSVASIGFNVMHDAGHGSFSGLPWVNKIFSLSLNLLGGNAYYWHHRHNLAHHTFTNIHEVDEDIFAVPVLRLHKAQPRKKFHKYQHVYWPALYMVSYALWIYSADFKRYFSGETSDKNSIPKMSFWNHVIFWVSKGVYWGIFVVIPLLMVGFWSFLIGYMIMLASCGLFITTIFQLAHVVEEAENPIPTPNGKIEDEWAMHQVKTTANFATNSKAISWMFGGLNFQIEHHLLREVSHVHYPKIQKIVKNLCLEFNLKYNEKKTFFKAIWSHIQMLKSLGTA